MVRPSWLFVTLATLLVRDVARAQVSATINPIYHGELKLKPALGTLDRTTGSAALQVRGWLLRPTPDSNGLYPDREPILVVLGEEPFRIDVGEVRASHHAARFSYRAPRSQLRGIRRLRLLRRTDGSYDVLLSLFALDLSNLLFEDPVCRPMAIIIGDDDAFSGVNLTRRSARSRQFSISRDCTPNTNWVWLERCGPGGAPDC